MKNPLQNLPSLQITHFESCDSTNRLLLSSAESGAAAGTVFVTREQVAGRGRRGRHWLAAAGDSLTFSLLWTFPADPAKLTGLSLVVGLAVIRTMSEKILGHRRQDVRCGLKWPNDVLIQRADGCFAKAGGILIESVVRVAPGGGKELAVVIGIGLNCTESRALSESVADQTVAAMSELFDAGVTPDVVFPVLLDTLLETLGEFSSRGFAGFCAEWNAHNLWQDCPVQIREGDAVLHEGICRGVDDEGVLCIETAAGIQRIVSGDVSLRKV